MHKILGFLTAIILMSAFGLFLVPSVGAPFWGRGAPMARV